ncbi:MAG: 2-oxo acid dehydrogenase subunit E2 [Pseudomonadales bacterium]|jgi:pyruvate dehydrogenase E2 component (dihydrolipoamide acetyltransferase)
MPTEVYLVKVGMNMTEGIVEEWYVADGSTVQKGELLYRLETEKVNLDVDADASGIVKHLVAEGVTKAPGDVVGYIFAEDEEIPEKLMAAAAPTAPAGSGGAERRPAAADEPVRRADDGDRVRASPIARRLATERGLDLSALEGSGPDGRIVEADIIAVEATEPRTTVTGAQGDRRSSPMARRLARELGVDLTNVTGTGPGGRITRDDVEMLAGARPEQAGSTPEAADRSIPFRGMRRTIATRMHQSLSSTAQLTMDMDVRMDEAVKLRNQLIDEWADQGVRPTYTDLVIRAAAKALRRHPHMNSQLAGEAIVLKGDVHVGMAVSLEDGLIVPVIRHADRLSVEETARASSRLSAAAREGSLTPDDLQGGTFTVTAMGMFGVDSFTPILNAPQAGILGVNRIREDTAWEAGTPVRVQRMRLSLTWDHRVLDGAPAARFLADVRDLLEAPYRLLV